MIFLFNFKYTNKKANLWLLFLEEEKNEFDAKTYTFS